MKPSLVRIATASLVYLSLLSPLGAAAQSKDEVADRLSKERLTDYSGVQIFRNLVTLDLSPEIWAYAISTNAQDGLLQIGTFAPAIKDFAKRMGWGDLEDLTRSSTVPQDQNPLIGQMVDSWKDKISLKLVCHFKPTGQQAISKAINNLCSAAFPLEQERVKPRSGKMFLTITASPTATKLSVTVSPDGTTFDAVVPIYADYSQDVLADQLALRGK